MAPAAHTSQTPTNTGFDNGSPITRGVGFYVTVDLTVSGIYFWVPSTNTGTYTAGLWQTTADDDPDGTGTGSLLETGSIAAAGVTAGQWDVVPLDAPVDLTTGVLYRAGVHASSGWFASTPSVMGTPISGNDVTLYASGDDPFGGGTVRNGCFNVSGSLAYPGNAFSSTDYFIDVELGGDAVTGELDATLPTLVAAAAGTSISAGTLAATLPALEVDLSDSVTAAARSTPAVTAAQTSDPVVTAGRTSTPSVSARRTSTATVG